MTPRSFHGSHLLKRMVVNSRYIWWQIWWRIGWHICHLIWWFCQKTSPRIHHSIWWFTKFITNQTSQGHTSGECDQSHSGVLLPWQALPWLTSSFSNPVPIAPCKFAQFASLGKSHIPFTAYRGSGPDGPVSPLETPRLHSRTSNSTNLDKNQLLASKRSEEPNIN